MAFMNVIFLSKFTFYALQLFSGVRIPLPPSMTFEALFRRVHGDGELAEREGFEPSMDREAHTGFRDQPVQPLWHLSRNPADRLRPPISAPTPLGNSAAHDRALRSTNVVPGSGARRARTSVIRINDAATIIPALIQPIVATDSTPTS